MKNLIDTYFETYYDFHSGTKICEHTTHLGEFDLADKVDEFIVVKGNGVASYVNSKQEEIKVLSYEKFVDHIKKRRQYKKIVGKGVCDYIIVGVESSIIILNELTTSVKGIENLTYHFPGQSYSKFDKVEKQLSETLLMLYNVPEIANYIDAKGRKICLTSYKLYCGKHNAAIAFDRPNQTLSRIAGENGVNISLPPVEKLGFKYYRMSHDYSFTIT